MIKFENFVDTYHGNLLPLFRDPNSLKETITLLCEPYLDKNIDFVVSIDASGFIIAGAMAINLGAGFIPIRKAGKLKREKISSGQFVDSSKLNKELEIEVDSIPKESRVVLVDEWADSGAQLKNAVGLLNKLDVKIVGVSVVLDETSKEFKNSLNLPYHFLTPWVQGLGK